MIHKTVRAPRSASLLAVALWVAFLLPASVRVASACDPPYHPSRWEPGKEPTNARIWELVWIPYNGYWITGKTIYWPYNPSCGSLYDYTEDGDTIRGEIDDIDYLFEWDEGTQDYSKTEVGAPYWECKLQDVPTTAPKTYPIDCVFTDRNLSGAADTSRTASATVKILGLKVTPDLDMLAVGTTVTLTATVTPSLTGGSYIWDEPNHVRFVVNGQLCEFTSSSVNTVVVKVISPGADVGSVRAIYASPPDDIGLTVGLAKLTTFTVVQAETTGVSFGGSGYHAVTKDDGSAEYGAPHWVDNSNPLDGDADDAGDCKYPVCFTRGTTMSLTVTLRGGGPSPILIKGDGPGALDFAPRAAAANGSDLTVADWNCSAAFANAVGYFSPLTIQWQASFDGGTTWLDAGSSQNEVFVTLGTPACATRYRTVMYLACKNAGGTDAASCLANTWTAFSGPSNVSAWDETSKTYSRKLYYYQTSNGNWNTTTAELLSDGEGQCHSWAHLFKECLLANSVGSYRTRVVPPSGCCGFGVKRVAFDDASPEHPSDDPWKYGDSDLDIAPPPSEAEGIAGQNMATPGAKLFICHFIVHPNGSALYYDPSYGLTASGASAYTAAGADAWQSAGVAIGAGRRARRT